MGRSSCRSTRRAGQLVFGSDTYSSWEGIRDWFVANIQQTDTIQQFLAYEKCYVLTSTAEQLQQLHLRPRAEFVYAAYPITANWWNIPNGTLLAGRRADPGQRRADARPGQPEPDAVRRQHRATSSHQPVA